MKNVTIRFLRNVEGWRRGETVDVTMDDYTSRLVENGFVEVVDDRRLKPPARNASRDAWVAFLTEQGRTVHPQATRRQLIDEWDGVEHRG